MEALERSTRDECDDKVGRLVFWHDRVHAGQNPSRDESKLTETVYDFEKRDEVEPSRVSSHSRSQETSRRGSRSLHQDSSSQHYDKIYHEIFGPNSARRHPGDTGTSLESSATESTFLDREHQLADISMEDTIYEEVPKDVDDRYFDRASCFDGLFLRSKSLRDLNLNPIRCERVGPTKSELRISLALDYPADVLDSLPTTQELSSAVRSIRCSSTRNPGVSDQGACVACNSEDRSLDATYFPMPNYKDDRAFPTRRALFISPSESTECEAEYGPSGGNGLRGDQEQARGQQEANDNPPAFYDQDMYYDNEEDDRAHILSLNSFIPFDDPSRTGRSQSSRSRVRSRKSSSQSSKNPSSQSSKPPSSQSSGRQISQAQPLSLVGAASGSSEVQKSRRSPSGRSKPSKPQKANTVDELMGRETPDPYSSRRSPRPRQSARAGAKHASESKTSKTDRSDTKRSAQPSPTDSHGSKKHTRKSRSSPKSTSSTPSQQKETKDANVLNSIQLKAREDTRPSRPSVLLTRRKVQKSTLTTASTPPTPPETSQSQTGFRSDFPRYSAPSFDEDPYPSFDEQSCDGKANKPQAKPVSDEIMGDEIMGRSGGSPLLTSRTARPVSRVTPLRHSVGESIASMGGAGVMENRRRSPRESYLHQSSPTQDNIGAAGRAYRSRTSAIHVYGDDTFDELMGPPGEAQKHQSRQPKPRQDLISPTSQIFRSKATASEEAYAKTFDGPVRADNTSPLEPESKKPKQTPNIIQPLAGHYTTKMTAIDRQEKSSIDSSSNGAHEVPEMIQYVSARAASSLDDTDLENAHAETLNTSASAADTAPDQPHVEKGHGDIQPTKIKSADAQKPPRMYERIFGTSSPIDSENARLGRIYSSYKDTRPSLGMRYVSREIDHATFRQSQPPADTSRQTPTSWRDFLFSPSITSQGLGKQQTKESFPSDECRSRSSKNESTTRESVDRRQLEESRYLEEAPLLLNRSVPHLGTVETVPHILTPTDSAIFATVDRLLGGGVPSLNLDDQDTDSDRATPLQDLAHSIDLSQSQSDCRSELYPRVWEMAQKSLAQEAAAYISAALRLLPSTCGRHQFGHQAPLPLKSSCFIIEVVDYAKVEANIEASRLVRSIPACHEGIAPLGGDIPIAKLDELLYKSEDDTLDVIKVLDKFAGAHPDCLPASIGFLYADKDAGDDRKVSAELRIMAEIPQLLKSGKPFQCRHLYVLAWSLTSVLSTALRWWDTWNTPWTQAEDEDEEDLYQG